MTIPRKQIFAYLPDKQVFYLDRIQKERGIKSRSKTIERIIEDVRLLNEPRIKTFLEMEGLKRSIDPKDLMSVAMDVLRDFMRGVIS